MLGNHLGTGRLLRFLCKAFMSYDLLSHWMGAMYHSTAQHTQGDSSHPHRYSNLQLQIIHHHSPSPVLIDITAFIEISYVHFNMHSTMYSNISFLLLFKSVGQTLKLLQFLSRPSID